MSKRNSIILRVMVRIWEQSEIAQRFGRDQDARLLAMLFGRLEVLHNIYTADNLLELV